MEKVGAFVVIIAIGFFCRRIGLFSEKDFKVISKLVLNVTLPCSIIYNFSQFEVKLNLLMLIVLGMACNLVLILVGYLISSKNDTKDCAFNIINMAGYNVGCFALPFIQFFFGVQGVVATCLFDTGNSVFVASGTYTITQFVTKQVKDRSLKSILKTQFTSFLFDVYLFSLILSLLHIQLPTFVLGVTETVSKANGVLAMFMLGIGLNLNFEKSYYSKTASKLLLRYAISAVLAILCYFFLPVSTEVKYVIIILLFAPIASLATVFTEKSHANLGLSAMMNSMSVVMSLIIMTVLVMVMHI